MTALTKPDQLALAPVPAHQDRLFQIIERAVEGGHIDAVERLVALQERMEDRAAVRAFNAAFIAFQSECPVIEKDSRAEVLDRQGGVKFAWNYAKLEQIAEKAGPVARRHGLSWYWDQQEAAEKDQATVVCHLRHVGGHGTSASLTLTIAGPAHMSEADKLMGTIQRGQRRTLGMVLGIALQDPEEGDGPLITEDQRMQLEEDLFTAKVKPEQFLRIVGRGDLADIPVKHFQFCRDRIKQIVEKRKQEAEAAS